MFNFHLFSKQCYLSNRASKLSVVQLVYISTSKNRPAIGKTRLRTANWRTKNAKWSHCCTRKSPCARTASWPAETPPVSKEASSVTARRTVPMVPTKTLAVSTLYTAVTLKHTRPDSRVLPLLMISNQNLWMKLQICPQFSSYLKLVNYVQSNLNLKLVTELE